MASRLLLASLFAIGAIIASALLDLQVHHIVEFPVTPAFADAGTASNAGSPPVSGRAASSFTKDIFAHSTTLVRVWLTGLFVVALSLIAAVILAEIALESHDVARLMPGQTFAQVGAARIRYRLLGETQPGSTVVLLSGLNGSIEQLHNLQRALSVTTPCLAYDRAGYGFSEGSSAHSAKEQAEELTALLDTLEIRGRIVLVGYSFSGLIARVFADRFPEKLAALYLIEPTLPELNECMPELHSPRRYLRRFIAHHLLASSFGYIRLIHRLRSWRGPDSLVEQRAEAVLGRRSHYWAQALEWYALPNSWQQALKAQIPSSLPLEIAFPKQTLQDDVSETTVKLYADLAARSRLGQLMELENIDHSELLKAGPVLDELSAHIRRLARADAERRAPPDDTQPQLYSEDPV